ncbi:hypothetical protein [Streptomyces mirabilis]|uniref:hypothetical protein n=1 Tax=Streptomyces mirabilis TaxID=68239 RepID=UPI0035E2A996
MFEIRVICDATDVGPVTKGLTEAFTLGAVRRDYTRDGKRLRLYVTADHRPQPEPWPTAEEAYATAPSITGEIGWTAGTAADKPFGEDLDREYWLRKAALLDRIALDYEADGAHHHTADIATKAARQLIEIDYGSDPYWPEHPDMLTHPRGYVRQEYARWANNQ